MCQKPLLSLFFLLFLVNKSWASLIAPPKTEPVTLDDNNRDAARLALEEMEPGLSGKIDLDTLETKRVVGVNHPVFFKQGYRSERLDETYTHFTEVFCKQSDIDPNMKWKCSNSGDALVFPLGDSEQTVWLSNVDLPFAIKIIDFLKTKPDYECFQYQKNAKPCTDIFDEEKLSSYSGTGEKHTSLQAGDHREHPYIYYELKPLQCDDDPCELKITHQGMIMY